MNEQRPEPPNLAFFFDCENIGLADCDVAQMMQWVALQGRPIIRRAYGDWSKGARLKSEMLAAAVELVDMPSDQRGKNRADIRLVVDAMEILFTRNHVDTFVIVSGDSDFIPLVSRIRELGRKTIVVARRNNASPYISAACDSFVYFDEIAKALPSYPDRLEVARQMVQNVAAKLTGDGKRLTTDTLKKGLTSCDPRFCPTRYGFPAFDEFLDAVAPDVLNVANNSSLNDIDDTKQQEQTKPPSNGTPAVANKKQVLANDLLDKIYWAVELLQAAGRGISNLGHIHGELRVLFPEFKVSTYGFAKKPGLRKIFSLMELEGFCSLESTKKQRLAPWIITFEDSFFQRKVQLKKPSTFEERLNKLARKATSKSSGPNGSPKCTIPKGLPTCLPGPTIPNPFPVPSFAGRRKAGEPTQLDHSNGSQPAKILEFSKSPESTSAANKKSELRVKSIDDDNWLRRIEWFEDDELAELLDGERLKRDGTQKDESENTEDMNASSHRIQVYSPDSQTGKKGKNKDQWALEIWDDLDEIPF